MRSDHLAFAFCPEPSWEMFGRRPWCKQVDTSSMLTECSIELFDQGASSLCLFRVEVCTSKRFCHTRGSKIIIKFTRLVKILSRTNKQTNKQIWKKSRIHTNKHIDSRDMDCLSNKKDAGFTGTIRIICYCCSCVDESRTLLLHFQSEPSVIHETHKT